MYPQSMRRIPIQLGARALSYGFTAATKTCDVRVAYYDRSVDPALPEFNEHCILVFWHENFSILIPQWSGSPPPPVALLLSQHRDAELLNDIAQSFGLNTVRGSSTRGGSAAVRQLKQICTQFSIAITPDGPRGPRRTMANGPLYLASRLQMPLVPVGIGYENPIRLNTWDQFAVPRLFSRVRLVSGPKIRLAPGLDRKQLADQRLRLETLLNQLTDFAERWANSKMRIRGERICTRPRRFWHPKPVDDAQTPPSPNAGRRAA